MNATSKCTRKIEIDKLYLEDNIRTPECHQIPLMVDSIKRHGFKDNHPLVVHDNGERGFIVLCGNRRVLGVRWIQENEPEVFAKLFPNGKVPAVVHSGLTIEEQILLRIDHSKDEDRVSLDEWSTFLAIKQLVQAFGGESQTEIAEKLGLFHEKGKNAGQPNRSYVQPRVSLSRLPQYVQDQYEVLSRQGKDDTPVRWTQVKPLYTMYNREFAEYPEGNGPQFAELWQKTLNPPTKDEKAKDATKSLSANDARTRAQSASSNIVKRVLLASTGQGSMDLTTIDTQAVVAEQAETTLAAIQAYLGDNDYNQLVADAIAQVVEATDEATDEATVEVA